MGRCETVVTTQHFPGALVQDQTFAEMLAVFVEEERERLSEAGLEGPIVEQLDNGDVILRGLGGTGAGSTTAGETSPSPRMSRGGRRGEEEGEEEEGTPHRGSHHRGMRRGGREREQESDDDDRDFDEEEEELLEAGAEAADPEIGENTETELDAAGEGSDEEEEDVVGAIGGDGLKSGEKVISDTEQDVESAEEPVEQSADAEGVVESLGSSNKSAGKNREGIHSRCRGDSDSPSGGFGHPLKNGGAASGDSRSPQPPRVRSDEEQGRKNGGGGAFSGSDVGDCAN